MAKELNPGVQNMMHFAWSLGHGASSSLKKITNPGDVNRSLIPFGSPNDSNIPQVITSPERSNPVSIGFDPTSLIGREYLQPIEPDGTHCVYG